MKVFVVYFCGEAWQDDAYIVDVFSTQEKAQIHIDIEEKIILNSVEEIKELLPKWIDVVEEILLEIS